MPRVYIPTILREMVATRARWCCEYCLIHQDDVALPHHIDHLIALKHSGKTESANLALACQLCNRYKGADFMAFDPASRVAVSLFNPRLQLWRDHFALQGDRIIGLTEIGRATIELLRINSEARLIDRRLLIETRRYPPAWFY